MDEDYRVKLLAIENRRLVGMIEHKNHVIRVLLDMVEKHYPGLTSLMTTDEALKSAKPFDTEVPHDSPMH